MSTTKRTLLLVGATGLVGRHVLAQALADDRVGSVVAPARRDLPAHPKRRSPRIDYEHLDEGARWWHADAGWVPRCALRVRRRPAGAWITTIRWRWSGWHMPAVRPPLP